MTLSDLIRKGGLGKAATATTATLATQGAEKAPTVAAVATVAVASSASSKSEVASAEQIPRSPMRTPTAAEAAELRALIRAIGDDDQWAAQDIEDATAAALADPDGALRCYRAIAGARGLMLLSDEDDKRRCTDCANLAASGLCLAARRGDIAASREYHPVPTLPRRCEGYAPKPTDPDQRAGRERWPGLTTKGGDHADT
jgi:hypothetical protein